MKPCHVWQDGSKGFYDKWIKSGREGQMPYGFTYMWNLKGKQNKTRLTEAETKGELPGGRGR